LGHDDYLKGLNSLKIASREEFPLYRLIEDESQNVFVAALDIEGFFVKSDRVESRVWALGASTPVTRAARLHDVELQVLDLRGEVIGSYYVGEAEMLDRRAIASNGRVDIEISFQGYSCPFPRAGEIWRRWALGAPSVPGEWRRLPPDWHESWLHVVQTAWFQAGRTASRDGSESSYVMDGSGIENTASFYCEIGEAINGPGGYFGSGLDALADCLRSAVSIGPFELVWRNFNLSKENLGEPEVESLVAVLQEFGVRLLQDPLS
jgi:RNAse (barnase) inhibitor barstar